MRHDVIVGNHIGTVYSGNDARAAGRTYGEYMRQSHSGIGRAAGASVTWKRDGKVYCEHVGLRDDEVDDDATPG